MKKVWIKAIPWDKNIVTTAIENGADGVYVEKEYTNKVLELGIIDVISENGNIKVGKDVVFAEINNKKDEENVLKISKNKIVVVKTTDWKIIPLENLISQTKGLYSIVHNFDEAKTAISILEKGVDGVLVDCRDINEIKKIISIKNTTEKIELVELSITKKKILGMGDRVCVDTCTNMNPGEGMLVGNNSNGMFLVHSESIENPYVEKRPFRINAGGVHAYTLVSGNKTKYLSELRSGEEVLIVNYKGETQIAIVGRVKIERRPMILIEANFKKECVSLILQNAETIRLTQPNGSPVSIVNLKKGTKVLGYLEKSGRHFGIRVDETIIEK